MLNGNFYFKSWKSDNYYIESNQEKKQRTDIKNEAKKILSNNFTRSNRKKSNWGFEILENDQLFCILGAPILFVELYYSINNKLDYNKRLFKLDRRIARHLVPFSECLYQTLAFMQLKQLTPF